VAAARTPASAPSPTTLASLKRVGETWLLDKDKVYVRIAGARAIISIDAGAEVGYEWNEHDDGSRVSAGSK
jgi:hypothetical protein